MTPRTASAERRVELEQELARFLPLLAGPGGAEKVILFGSLARNEGREDSDLDLVVVKKTSLPFWRRIAEVRRLLKPRVAADVLVYTPDEFAELSAERPFVRDEVVRDGRVVYERP